MSKRSRKITSISVICAVFLILYAITMIFIILWGFSASLKAPSGTVNAFRGNELGIPKGLPWEWEWSNYGTVFSYLKVRVSNGEKLYYVNFGGLALNTLFYALGGSIIATMTPCLVAYAVAKSNFRFNNLIIFIVITAMVVPIIGSYPSEIQVLKTLNLYDTWLGAAIQKMNFLGVYFLVFLATFKSISNYYAEAAYIEGAGEYCVMFRIMLPLAKNVIMTVMLILFIQFWNDYQYPLLFLPNKPTLAFGVYYLIFLNTENKLMNIPMKMAGSIILFIPILLIFIMFRNALMQNLSMGGVKE